MESWLTGDNLTSFGHLVFTHFFTISKKHEKYLVRSDHYFVWEPWVQEVYQKKITTPYSTLVLSYETFFLKKKSNFSKKSKLQVRAWCVHHTLVSQNLFHSIRLGLKFSKLILKSFYDFSTLRNENVCLREITEFGLQKK